MDGADGVYVLGFTQGTLAENSVSSSIVVTLLWEIDNVFFFFQAEDGIRDRNVTGVQTCALPISFQKLLTAQILALLAFNGELSLHHHLRGDAGMVGARHPQRFVAAHAFPTDDDVHRSEERRVGKECRVWWSQEC